MMKSYEMMWQRLPLHTCANARELGGYPTADGSQTAWHRFVRSDRLSFLDDDEREFSTATASVPSSTCAAARR
jgi:alkylated DNA nucleotide flippase Atl1